MFKDNSISVIILTYNSEKTIKACLDNLARIDYRKDKIRTLVIDHGSTDKTRSIVEKYNVEFYTFPEAESIGALRNIGVSMSESDIIAFLDSDCLPDPGWLSNAVCIMEKENVRVLGGDYYIRDDHRWVERIWYEHRKTCNTRYVDVIFAGNFIMTRKAFEDVGGFDISYLAGEDFDICLRLRKKGYKILSSEKIKVIHLGEARTLMEFWVKEVWHGEGMMKILTRHPGFNGIRVPMLSLFYLFSYITIISFLIFGYFKEAVIFFAILVLLVPAILGIKSCIGNSKQNLFGIWLLLFIYFTARAVSIVRYNQIKEIAAFVLLPLTRVRDN